MKFIICILIAVILFSCSDRQSEKTESITEINSQWITYNDTTDAGFILTFKYPNNLALADVIDNCRCVGQKIKNKDTNQGTDSTNSRQWSICMQDIADYSVDSLISLWKNLYKGQITEKRDTITIDNLKALQVTFKSDFSEKYYRKLIYLKKGSTLFEIMNVSEATNKDFETFYKSLTIKNYSKERKY